MLIFLAIVLFIILLVAAELEGAGPFIFFTSLFGFLWVGNFLSPVWDFTTTNILGSILGVLVYFMFGAVWSLFKWNKLINELVQRYPNAFESDGTIKKGLGYEHRFKPNTYSGRISAWIFCWPTSIILYIFGDFLVNLTRNVVKLVLTLFNDIYEKITNAAISRHIKKK